jgi:hypothetical protein
MKVTGPASSPSMGASSAASARPGGAGFSLAGLGAAAEAPTPARAASVGGVGSLEALIALQQVQQAEGPLERRKKAVNRAGKLLDVLDQIKASMLDGDLDAGALQRLSRAIHEERAATDDPKLEDLLNEIEVRAAVEQAKLQVARAA